MEFSVETYYKTLNYIIDLRMCPSVCSLTIVETEYWLQSWAYGAEFFVAYKIKVKPLVG